MGIQAIRQLVIRRSGNGDCGQSLGQWRWRL